LAEVSSWLAPDGGLRRQSPRFGEAASVPCFDASSSSPRLGRSESILMSSKAHLWSRILASDSWVLGLSVVYFLAVWPFAPDLANPENFELILSNMMPLAAVAIGQTLVVITGGIDLSVTAITALTSVAGAGAMVGLGFEGPAALLVGALVMVSVGAAVGAVNGLTAVRLSMPPFMVTLTTMMGFSGLAVYLTRSRGIPGLPDSLAVLSQESIGFIPLAVFVVAPLAIGAHVLLTKTRSGRNLYALGHNKSAARISGVPVTSTIILAYVCCGICAAVGSLLYTGRLETGSPVMGQRIFLDVIGAAVIGGASLFGGKGSVKGTVFGVLFITLIDNSLNILGFSSFTVLMAKGSVILLAALLDVVRARRTGGGR